MVCKKTMSGLLVAWLIITRKAETHETIGVNTGVGSVSTGAHAVDVQLSDGGPDSRMWISSCVIIVLSIPDELTRSWPW